MNKFNFMSPDDMLEEIKAGTDLYNPQTGMYAFLYNDYGSVAVYVLKEGQASKLADSCKELGTESWSELLGPGGSIYDDETHPMFNSARFSNKEWCETHFNEEWISAEEWGEGA